MKLNKLYLYLKIINIQIEFFLKFFFYKKRIFQNAFLHALGNKYYKINLYRYGS